MITNYLRFYVFSSSLLDKEVNGEWCEWFVYKFIIILNSTKNRKVIKKGILKKIRIYALFSFLDSFN